MVPQRIDFDWERGKPVENGLTNLQRQGLPAVKRLAWKHQAARTRLNMVRITPLTGTEATHHTLRSDLAHYTSARDAACGKTPRRKSGCFRRLPLDDD